MSMSPPQTRSIVQKIRRVAASLGIQQGPPVSYAMVGDRSALRSRRASTSGGSSKANLSHMVRMER